MRNELNLWVAGGDMRQAKLAELLAADGHTVHAYALERLGALDGVEMEESLEGAALADCVVLPLPAAGEGSLLNAPLSGRKHPLALVLDALRPGQVNWCLTHARRRFDAALTALKKDFTKNS